MNMDSSKVQALQQKRTIAFVNHFVLTNVQFLNNFMKNCEHKLMMFERKLEKVNASMVLLETRLSSIPEANIPTPKAPESTPTTAKTTESPNKSSEPEINKPPLEDPNHDQPDAVPSNSSSEYDRFVKMVHVGVPLPAVKLKLSLEGLEPEVLDQILGK